MRVFLVPESLLDHEFSSGEVRMVPDSPTVTKSSFPEVTPLSYFVGAEVVLVHVFPSGEVRMVPDSPTVTKSSFPVVTPL